MLILNAADRKHGRNAAFTFTPGAVRASKAVNFAHASASATRARLLVDVLTMNLQQLADEHPELLAAQLAPSLRRKYTLIRERPTFTTATADDCRAWDQEHDEWPDPLSSLALTCRSLHAVAVHDIIWRGFFEEQRFVFGKGVSGAELSRRWRQAGHPWFASPKPSIFAPSADFPSLQTNVCNWLAKNLNDIEGLGHLPPHLADVVRTEALGDLPPPRPMDGAGWWRRLFRATKILEERHVEHVTTTEKIGAVWDAPGDAQPGQPEELGELALLMPGLRSTKPGTESPCGKPT